MILETELNLNCTIFEYETVKLGIVLVKITITIKNGGQ